MSHPVTDLRKEDVDPIPEKIVPFIKRFMKHASRFNVWLYEKTDGKLGGKFIVGGAPVCLVTMTGRKTGLRRTTPLIHIPHGEDILLVASQGGLESHPLWYRNMVSNPEIEVNAFGNGENYARYTLYQKLAPRIDSVLTSDGKDGLGSVIVPARPAAKEVQP